MLAFTRGTFACVVNLSDRPVDVAVSGTVVLGSASIEGRLLPPDTAVWLVSA